MRKLLICALALGGFAASAQAADLSGGSMKDPVPDSITNFKDPIPDNLTVGGITLYGTVDVGFGYLTESAPTSSNMYWSQPYMISKFSRQGAWGGTDNALEQSKVGLKMEESLGNGFALIGKAETNFNPLSMQLADACAALTENNGKPVASWVSAANGSRCGQPFAGQYFVGLSNASYGTLTGGRQSSLQNDTISAYDPMGGSYAFSLIGFSGTADGGIGTSEDARWDNSIKYIYQYGPLHAGGMYSFGDQGTAIFGQAYGANVGGTYKGFSLDAVYTKQEGTAAAASETNVIYTNTDYLKATVTNNEAWSIQGKYVMELGGGFKDEGPSGKVTFSGGFIHIDLTNPNHDQSYYNGFQTAGWYRLAGIAAGNAFTGDKVLETAFGGVKYETGAWTLAGAYYHYHQNAFVTGGGAHCAAGASNCAGDENVGSFLLDYRFDKHFDVYSGVSYSDIAGGLASGFLKDTNTTFASGLRIKF